MKTYTIFINNPYVVNEQSGLLDENSSILEITSGDRGIPKFKTLGEGMTEIAF